jgi:hypothetical protein
LGKKRGQQKRSPAQVHKELSALVKKVCSKLKQAENVLKSPSPKRKKRQAKPKAEPKMARQMQQPDEDGADDEAVADVEDMDLDGADGAGGAESVPGPARD